MYGCWRCSFHWAVGWCWVKFEKQPRWEAPFIVEGPVSWGCLGMVNEWPPWCNDHWDIVRYTLEFRMLPSCIFFSLAVWSCLIWDMVRNGNWWKLDLWRSLKIPNRACSQVTPCPSLSVAGYSNYEFDPWTAEVHQAQQAVDLCWRWWTNPKMDVLSMTGS